MNARLPFLVAALFSFAISLPAIGSTTICYQGAIGDRLAVNVQFTWQDDGKISGSYRYANYGQQLVLEQTSEKDGVFRFRESVARERNVTGSFRGKFADDGVPIGFNGGYLTTSFTGTWSSKDGKRSLPVSLHKVAQSVVLAASQSDRYDVSIAYPKFSGTGPFYTAVNERVRAEAQTLFEKTLVEYRAATAKPDEAGVLPYEYTTGVEVIGASEKMISVLYEDCLDTGVAHPSYSYRSATYAWRDGKLVDLGFNELIGGDTAISKHLNSLCIQSLKRQKAGWPQEVKFGLDSPPVVNVTSGGLLFSFSPYQAGSYAEGSYCVLIQFNQFRDKLNRRSILASTD